MALIAAHLNAGHSGGDSVAIGIYSPYILSLFLHLHTPFPPSLISLMVSVDVKHHVCLLTYSYLLKRGDVTGRVAQYPLPLRVVNEQRAVTASRCLWLAKP